MGWASRRLRGPRCCECHTTFDLIQWGSYHYVCAACYELFHYGDFLPGIVSPKV